MSSRIGRPPSDNPKSSRVEIRMTPEEEEKLDYCCKVSGKSRSEVAREGIQIMYNRLCRLRKK